MKKVLSILLIVPAIAYAQTVTEKRFEIGPSQTLKMEFPYAELVEIKGWANNYVTINANVMINMGQNDDAYALDMESNAGGMVIRESIRDQNKLPEMIQLNKAGQVYYFETGDWNDPKILQFFEENGREEVIWMSHGVIKEIKLTIMVPARAKMEVRSKFGIIDIEGMDGEVFADSQHGGVDLAVPSTGSYMFVLNTDWGEIFTDLDLDLRQEGEYRKWKQGSNIRASLNGGSNPIIELVSKHGNIYLRKL